VGPGDRADDGQAESAAASRAHPIGVQPPERLEQRSCLLRGDRRPAAFVIRPLAVERDLEFGAHDGERRAQLVRGVGHEAPLGFEGGIEPGQHLVERIAEFLQLVIGAGQMQPLAEARRGQLACGRGELADRAQHALRDEPAERDGDQGERDQDQRGLAEHLAECLVDFRLGGLAAGHQGQQSAVELLGRVSQHEGELSAGCRQFQGRSQRVAGTYTALPTPGQAIRPGQDLYRVDNVPVVLMRGGTPAWRTFAPGMTGGGDVTELQRDLIALGFAAGLLTAPTGRFDALTEDAVYRWQQAAGYPVTGQITLGQVVFLPADVIVGGLNEAPGQLASPGQLPFDVMAASRIVTVALGPDLPSVTTGEAVSIVLPSGAATPGVITAIGPPPPAGGSGTNGSGSSGSGTSGTSGGSSGTSAELTITPDRPAATGTGQDVTVQVSLVTQSVRGVLAVPVTALLALAGGGYGVELAGPNGADRLVGVTTGLFANTLVEVSGPGLRAGMKVVTAQ